MDTILAKFAKYADAWAAGYLCSYSFTITLASESSSVSLDSPEPCVFLIYDMLAPVLNYCYTGIGAWDTSA